MINLEEEIRETAYNINHNSYDLYDWDAIKEHRSIVALAALIREQGKLLYELVIQREIDAGRYEGTYFKPEEL